jgi:GTPase SAR1 family protein
VKDLHETRTAAYAICGPAGQGKTQTAVKYYHNNKQHFKASLWVTADTEIKLLQGLSQFAQDIGLVDKSTDARLDAWILREWFEETSEFTCNEHMVYH